MVFPLCVPCMERLQVDQTESIITCNEQDMSLFLSSLLSVTELKLSLYLFVKHISTREPGCVSRL